MGCAVVHHVDAHAAHSPEELSALRVLKLAIAYDGTAYAGWQRQAPRAEARRRSIQAVVERAFQAVTQRRVCVVGSGRTDAGVHAEAQVAHAHVHSQLPVHRLLRALNHLLPPEIRVMTLEEAPAQFHARFSPSLKQYRYRIHLGGEATPFVARYVHQYRGAPLSLARMRREAARLKGRHNFKAFARASNPRRTAVRTLTDVRLTRHGRELWLEVEGDGFLHTMVRSIAGTLIDVGRGRLPEGTVRRMLQSRDRRLAGTTAPGKGLALVRVTYGKGGA